MQWAYESDDRRGFLTDLGDSGDAGHVYPRAGLTMRCRNCGQTRRMTLVIECGIQIAADGTRRLPDWGIDVQCPRCESTDVVADTVRLLTHACATGEC